MPYPSLTKSLHHEVELVVAIGTGGRDITAADAMTHVWGYAVGLDMTRRDLQGEAKKLGRPWDIGKGFDHSAPIGADPPRRRLQGRRRRRAITLEVNGAMRQQSTIGKLIWNIARDHRAPLGGLELQPGDLIFTGTPEGVAAVGRGDVLKAASTASAACRWRSSSPAAQRHASSTTTFARRPRTGCASRWR